MPTLLLLAVLLAPMLPPAVSPADTVDPDRLFEIVRSLPPNRTAWAAPAEQQVLKDTEDLLITRLRRLGYTPVEQPLDWTTGGVARVRTDDGWSVVPDPEPRTWRNISIEIPGRESPDEVILVGAHFDSVPGTPGADDNASGTAAALELARVLKDRPMRRTVRIVFFNLEEIGLIGSTEHAAWTKARLDAGVERLVGMMSLEMLGYYSDEPNSQRVPIPAIPGVFEPPTVADFLAVVATAPSAPFARELSAAMARAGAGVPIRTIDFIPEDGRAFPDVRRSDHAPFWDLGLPAVLITDTSEFRTPHYHSASDTADTLDPVRYPAAVRAVVEGVWRVAGPIQSSDQSDTTEPGRPRK